MLHERVLGDAFQLHARGLVLQFVPLALVVFLEEVAVADPADFGGELEIVGEQLAVLPEEAIAVGGFRRDGRMRPWPRLSMPWSWMPQKSARPATWPGMPNMPGAVVGERAAVAEAALAQVVEADVEIGALRLVADAQQLVAVPVGQELRAEDVVLLQSRRGGCSRSGRSGRWRSSASRRPAPAR